MNEADSGNDYLGLTEDFDIDNELDDIIDDINV